MHLYSTHKAQGRPCAESGTRKKEETKLVAGCLSEGTSSHSGKYKDRVDPKLKMTLANCQLPIKFWLTLPGLGFEWKKTPFLCISVHRLEPLLIPSSVYPHHDSAWSPLWPREASGTRNSFPLSICYPEEDGAWPCRRKSKSSQMLAPCPSRLEASGI